MRQAARQLAERSRQRENAPLGVSAAPTGLIVMRELSRCPVARVIEERVQIGQAEPAADKDCQQQECAQAS
jgi:hypothetical protein